MSPPDLPPEILDLIVDHLYDEQSTLKECGAVSKSWVPRARRHLFFHVEFGSMSLIELWMKAFPDPSNSPAHYARVLSLHGSPVVVSTGTHARTWVQTFRHIVELRTISVLWDYGPTSLVPLHGSFPTLKSLSISRSNIPPQELLGLICSFPLLRDLRLNNIYPSKRTVNVGWNVPSTSPELTGSLQLSGGITSYIWRSLDLLNCCFRFTKIVTTCQVGNEDLLTGWVAKCSDSLESLSIGFNSSGMFPLWLVNILSLPIYPVSHRAPSPFDLSKATKLKDMEFHLDIYTEDVRWITKTLLTIENLRQISVHIRFLFTQPIAETTYQEWRDLDRQLVELWISHSIRPEIKFLYREGHAIPLLFPELTVVYPASVQNIFSFEFEVGFQPTTVGAFNHR
jgi:hypothetical protein